MAADMLPSYHDLSYKRPSLVGWAALRLGLDGPAWHECGIAAISTLDFWGLFMALSSRIGGAGEGNRTLMTSLEDRYCGIRGDLRKRRSW